MMAVHPSGFYAWCAEPDSQRALEDRRLLGPIKQSWLESGAVYGYRKVSDDLRDLGEQCGINRGHRIMHAAGLHFQTGYGKRRFKRSGPASVVASNHLQWQFHVTEPNKVWVTDITYFVLTRSETNENVAIDEQLKDALIGCLRLMCWL